MYMLQINRDAEREEGIDDKAQACLPPGKWRSGQTLLNLAIHCGQFDAVRYLCKQNCEALCLTSADLCESMYDFTFVAHMLHVRG